MTAIGLTLAEVRVLTQEARRQEFERAVRLVLEHAPLGGPSCSCGWSAAKDGDGRHHTDHVVEALSAPATEAER